jgi:hypothetical protein
MTREPHEWEIDLARAEIFKPFDVFPRWEMLKPDQVRHELGCTGVKSVEFSTVERVRISRSEWIALKDITMQAKVAGDHPWLRGEPFSVTLRCHLATCTACHAETDAVSAVVSVSWAGRRLSREYAL